MDEFDVDGLEVQDEPRSAREVARRCLVLYAVLAAGHNESRPRLIRWLRDEDLWDAVSPDEAEFLLAVAPTRQQVIQATWRVETLSSLLWALGRIPEVPSPTEICDPQLVRSVLPHLYSPTTAFVAHAVLRFEEEILDANETIYQIHWAVRDAQLNGKPIPDGYDAGIVQEHHHALNWLIGYCGQDWDDVATDT